MTVLDDGRPLAVETERERIGQGAWARLFATAVVPDEGSSTAERGRALARGGQVHTVAVGERMLNGRVDDGAREYAVSIVATPVPPRIWAAAARSARGNPQLEAAVEGRAQSVQLEHVMAVDWEEPLVPGSGALERACSCEAAGACAHVAAFAYAIADRIDREPSLLLRWRGCTPPEDSPDPAPETDLEPIVASADIWEAGPLPEPHPLRPLPTGAVLKRLGPSGIQVGAQDLTEVLERAYASFAASRSN